MIIAAGMNFDFKYGNGLSALLYIQQEFIRISKPMFFEKLTNATEKGKFLFFENSNQKNDFVCFFFF